MGRIEYDIRSWPQGRLEDVLGALARSSVPFEVSGGKLRVDEDRKLIVGAIVASIVVDGAPPPDRNGEWSTFGTGLPAPPPPPPGFGTVGTVGAPPPVGPGVPVGTVVRPKASSYAIASLVLSLVWICGIGSVLAIVFGIMGIRHVDRSDGQVTGKGLAVAGIVLGILGIVLVVASLVFGEDPSTTGNVG